jgi:hypothetical protein
MKESRFRQVEGGMRPNVRGDLFRWHPVSEFNGAFKRFAKCVDKLVLMLMDSKAGGALHAVRSALYGACRGWIALLCSIRLCRPLSRVCSGLTVPRSAGHQSLSCMLLARLQPFTLS